MKFLSFSGYIFPANKYYISQLPLKLNMTKGPNSADQWNMSKSVQLVSHSLKQRAFALLPLSPSHRLDTGWTPCDSSGTTRKKAAPLDGRAKRQKKPGSLITPWRRAVTQLRVLHAGEVDLSFEVIVISLCLQWLNQHLN